jgi:type II secretory pathway pseudopilin PulG
VNKTIIKVNNNCRENQMKNSKERKHKKMNRNLKEKGITLVALVVTMIILLILAGVTINLVLSNNGY